MLISITKGVQGKDTNGKKVRKEIKIAAKQGIMREDKKICNKEP